MHTNEDFGTPRERGPQEGAPAPGPSSPQAPRLDQSSAAVFRPTPGFEPGVVLRQLHTGLIDFDKQFDSLIAAGIPSSDLGPALQSALLAAVSPFAPAGSDFTSAVAELRRRTMEAASEHSQQAPGTPAEALTHRIRELDSRFLLAGLERLPRVHELLGIADKEKQKQEAEAALAPTTINALRAELSGLSLTRLLASQISAAFADRTLDVTPILSVIRRRAIYSVGLQMALDFQTATRPDQGLGFAVLPYENPSRVKEAREEVRNAIWRAAVGNLQNKNEYMFYLGVSCLTAFGAEAIPHFREFFRRINSPASGELEPKWQTIRASLMAIASLGPRAFEPFVERGPTARLDKDPTSIVEDALMMTMHADDRLQELAFKFLRVVAADDIRVIAKFWRLGNQIQDLPHGVVSCVISMNPVEKLLEWAEDGSPFVRAEAIRALIGIEKRAGIDCESSIVQLLDRLERPALALPLDHPVSQAFATRIKPTTPPPASESA